MNKHFTVVNRHGAITKGFKLIGGPQQGLTVDPGRCPIGYLWDDHTQTYVWNSEQTDPELIEEKLCDLETELAELHVELDDLNPLNEIIAEIRTRLPY